jgi:hypothetical protein
MSEKLLEIIFDEFLYVKRQSEVKEDRKRKISARQSSRLKLRLYTPGSGSCPSQLHRVPNTLRPLKSTQI